MDKFSMDTDKIKEAGEELGKIATDYNTIISEVYNKLNKIVDDGIWLSENPNGSAYTFIDAVMKDKTSTDDLAKSMANLGADVVSFSKDINTISDNKL